MHSAKGQAHEVIDELVAEEGEGSFKVPKDPLVAQYQEFLEQENQQIAASIQDLEDQLDNQESQWAMEEEEMLRELRGLGYEEDEDTVEAQK
jgi:hypothetical protein